MEIHSESTVISKDDIKVLGFKENPE